MQVYTVTATFATYGKQYFCGVEYEDQYMGVFSTKKRAMDSLREYCKEYNWQIHSIKVSSCRVDQVNEFKNQKVIFDERVEELMTEEECEEYGVI